MLSANEEIIGDRVVTTELEHFAVVEGRVALTPHPNGRRSRARFTLIENDEKARRAVFSNPAHDFPRRIVYYRLADDNLVIQVSGEQRGSPLTPPLDLKRREPPQGGVTSRPGPSLVPGRGSSRSRGRRWRTGTAGRRAARSSRAARRWSAS